MYFSQKQLFYKYVGQTSINPIGLEIVKAEGIYLLDSDGNKYIDLASGVAVSNYGHNHPKIVNAVVKQARKYMHLMVYGEYIQSPQVEFAKNLCNNLPDNLNNVFFVNSGSEAIEGALKLSKRYTGRTEIIAFKNAYHGSTHGALSIGHERLKNAFLPLLPDIKYIEFNKEVLLEKISTKTACVVVEPIQAEGGIILPKNDFIKNLSNQCKDVGALLVFDEVQTGFGRTGKLFAFEHFNVIPDILVLAKAMGAGMPIGAFVSDRNIMKMLTSNPSQGHITTFGGHPVSAAAACAGLDILLKTNLLTDVNSKGRLFFENLKEHPKVKIIRGKGLLIAVELYDDLAFKKFMKLSLKYGIITDPFLFSENAFRISPPLTITKKEIDITCEKLIAVLNEI